MDITDRARRLAERAARLPKRAGRKLKQIVPDLPSASDTRTKSSSKSSSKASSDTHSVDEGTTQSGAARRPARRGDRPKAGASDPIARAKAIAADTQARANHALERARSVAGTARDAERSSGEPRREAGARVPSERSHHDDSRGAQDGDAERSNLADRTKNELYGLAKEHDLTGRSTMDKGELVEALRERDLDERDPDD